MLSVRFGKLQTAEFKTPFTVNLVPCFVFSAIMTSRDSPETTTQNPGEDTLPQGRDSESTKSGENQDQSQSLLSPDSLSSESQSDQNQEKPVDSGADLSAAASQWQAVWAPQYNMYYFYNPVTHETTWANPLQPEAGSSYLTASKQTAPSDPQNLEEDAETYSSTDLAATSQYAALQAAAIAQGIDPLLAHLDPSLRASMQGASNVPGGMPLFFISQLQPLLSRLSFRSANVYCAI
jgi:hypothetical protein